jgi:hypothetical protein
MSASSMAGNSGGEHWLTADHTAGSANCYFAGAVGPSACEGRKTSLAFATMVCVASAARSSVAPPSLLLLQQHGAPAVAMACMCSTD